MIRRLMREAQVNLAIRWFVGHALHEALPDHSSLTRIRQRWGEDVCPLMAQCLPRGATSRRVHIVTKHAAILRARRKRAAWGDDEHAIHTRHRWRVEGAHGTAKTLTDLPGPSAEGSKT